jgi:hypothetical protein
MPLGRPQPAWEGATHCPGSQERCPGRAMTTLEERVASMPNSSLRPRGGTLLAFAILLMALLAPAASAASVQVDLRVVETGGQTLADQTQFTDTVTFRTDPGADCFGPPGGSGNNATIQGPTAMGAMIDASLADSDLRPVSITDQFSFGLGLCGIGGYVAGGDKFWYLKHNHAGAQIGGDQLAVKRGDDVLWYLSPGFPPPDELELVAPGLAKPGDAVPVSVFSYDDAGERKPAAGAIVTGAEQPTDANGATTVIAGAEGTFPLRATRGVDIPSNIVNLTVDTDLDPCAAQAAESIIGTRKRDKIDGTDAPDTISARGGKDRVRAAGGCADAVDCGSGRDKATVDATDEVRRCNKVRVR